MTAQENLAVIFCLVPRAGLEPARPYGHDILSVARLTNFATRATLHSIHNVLYVSVV